MKFRSYLNYGQVESTSSGDTERKTFKRRTNADGSWTIVEDGTIDIQKMINSACPPSIANILQHARRGDTTLLNVKTGAVYEDVSQIRGDFGDVLSLSKKNAALMQIAKKEADRIANEKKEGDLNGTT